jgi:hypothetical protein
MPDHDDSLVFVRTWAEAVVRQLDRVREIVERDETDDRNYERMEDWSPTEEELQANFRVRWAEEHILVWAAYQLERWTRRRRSTGTRFRQSPIPSWRECATLLSIWTKQLSRRAKRSVGHAERTGHWGSYPTEPWSSRWVADGLVAIEDVERPALAVLKRINDELEAELQVADRFRGGEGEPAAEDAEPREQPLPARSQQIMAPLHRGVQGAVSVDRVHRACGEQREAAVESLQQRRRGEHVGRPRTASAGLR